MAYKVLKGFEKYVFFDDGRVWSRSKHHFMNPCINVDGYPQTMFNRKSKTVHRLIAMAFVQNPHNYTEVNHIDGNKQNNHFTNLEWCTRSHNVKHTYKLKLNSQKGEQNGNSKLTANQVKNIRQMLKRGFSHAELAKKYNVTSTTIRDIHLRNTWR